MFELGILHTSLIKGYESREEGYKLRVKVKRNTSFYVGNLTGEESHYYEVIVVNNLKLKSYLLKITI